MNSPRILVAGIGNIFLGDDAFGVQVVRRLARHSLPEQVNVIDFGIRGLDLVYALLDGYECVILVDAVQRGGVPGTLYLIEPEVVQSGNESMTMEGHSLDPAKVLRLARTMGSQVKRLYIVGCEPSPQDQHEEMIDGLSLPVQAALSEAIRMIESLIVD
jgi:hydrogenase maturation protease